MSIKLSYKKSMMKDKNKCNYKSWQDSAAEKAFDLGTTITVLISDYIYGTQRVSRNES